MLYEDYLHTVTDCPFCNPPEERIISSNEHAFLTYSIAPYDTYHLLVIPFRHVDRFENLNDSEHTAIQSLLLQGVELLKKLDRKNYSILLRNGEGIGKTVPHLHYHIIPNVRLGKQKEYIEDRIIVSPEEGKNMMETFKKILL
jgi:diadenosine tetraphosphate (Ap4A) HIT family hydrolase